ncbi:MAG: DegV family protein [Anaerolineales bacterium]|jgi:DegV family protein with EDD domain
MKLGIVTDSTSDLPQHIIDEHEIEVVPAVLVLDGQSYTDGKGVSREEYYTRLPDMKQPPTTASPSTGDFVRRFQKLFDTGCDHILSIHAAVELTTIVDVARLAAHDFRERITVLDSGSLSLGLGFQVLAAIQAKMDNLSLEGILEAIRSTRQRTKVIAALDTMEYLRRSGRVPGAVAALGGLLRIKPIVELLNGEVKPLGAVRTTRQAGERIYNALKELGPLEHLAILHTNAEHRARQLLDELMATVSQSIPRDILMVNVTTVIGTHVGPNGLGFAAVKV